MKKQIAKKTIILYVLKMLEDYPEQNKPITYTDMAKTLKAMGIQCDRKTVGRNVDYLIEFLGVDSDSVESAISSLAIAGKIKIYNGDKIYLTSLFNAEKNISYCIRRLAEEENQFKTKKVISKLDNGIVLTDEQKKCVKSVFNSQV